MLTSFMVSCAAGSGTHAPTGSSTHAPTSDTEVTQGPEGIPKPTVDFSQFHGFNLLGKLALEWSNDGYREADFELIRALGFNFVRLPIDYRTYTHEGDWLQFDEASLAQLDRTIAFGRERGIHVCINLHRAPGYTVATPSEATSLWDDPRAQSAFLSHWTMFANRYAEVPGTELSFNLLNEPGGVSDSRYGELMRPVIEAIWAESPQRPILVDGLEGAKRPVDSLADLDIVQSTRGYYPLELSHYKASWIQRADVWPEPQWPPPAPSYRFHFYGPAKPEWHTPLTIQHRFEAGSVLAIQVHQVSGNARLQVRADGSPIWTKSFRPSGGSGEWKQENYVEEFAVYQNVYDRVYEIRLPSASTVSLEVVDGDWLQISQLALTQGGEPLRWTPSDSVWGGRQPKVAVKQGQLVAAGEAPIDPETVGRARLREHYEPWFEFKGRGGRVFVGELGAYRHTPHEVVLAWLEDLLSVYSEHQIGWAAWNFRGPFGVFESKRADVVYQHFQGLALDRKMLNALLDGRMDGRMDGRNGKPSK